MLCGSMSKAQASPLHLEPRTNAVSPIVSLDASDQIQMPKCRNAGPTRQETNHFGHVISPLSLSLSMSICLYLSATLFCLSLFFIVVALLCLTKRKWTQRPWHLLVCQRNQSRWVGTMWSCCNGNCGKAIDDHTSYTYRVEEYYNFVEKANSSWKL